MSGNDSQDAFRRATFAVLAEVRRLENAAYEIHRSKVATTALTDLREACRRLPEALATMTAILNNTKTKKDSDTS